MADILVVDDQTEVRTLLCRVLESAGHRVSEAADGSAALQFLESHRPDVVVTDIFMPNLDGFDVARALQRFANPPAVISITGDHRAVTHDLAVMLGVRTTLLKPFAPKQLLAAVSETLDERAGAADAPDAPTIHVHARGAATDFPRDTPSASRTAPGRARQSRDQQRKDRKAP